MIQDTLRSIGGVGLYGVLSITLFFVVFTGTLVWAFGLKKDHLDSMGGLPLEDDSPTGAAPRPHPQPRL